MVRNKRSNPEHELQSACVEWFRYQFPNYRLRLFAIPNGGKRNIRTAVKLKREGVLPGVPDLFLAIPRLHYGGLWIEMKAGAAGKITEAQKELHAELSTAYSVKVARSFSEFEKIIKDYL